jgi:hypothetical protein
MRKLVAIGVLIGGLLAGAGSAMAQGGHDPLGLAASGALIPFITQSTFTSFNNGVALPFIAVVEVASPVGPNTAGWPGTYNSGFDLHMVFFNTTCARVGSASLPETTNDIGFVDIGAILNGGPGGTGVNGLVAIAGTSSGNELVPLTSPIHSRVYEFGVADGRSRVFEPIIIDSAEFPSTVDTWSPLRTGATFYAPLETGSVKTVLTLVCPRSTIQNFSTQNLGIFPIVATPGPANLFPIITPKFNNGTTPMSGRVYDTNEVLLRDINFTCDCLTEISVATFIGGAVYSETTDPIIGGIGAQLGTYTELEVTDPNPDTGGTSGSFTGYRSVSTTGSASNNFFGRLSNASRASLKSTSNSVTPRTR